ncbi:MAG: hypothetical protein JKY91_02205 [Emcibacter sp.]|nr:hypothetical protein [Emcibacter sp.]
MRQKILFISRDPGGTNQLVALRDILLGPDCDSRTEAFGHLGLSSAPDITVIAKDYAKAIWQQNSIAVLDWPDHDVMADIGGYLAGFGADQIITGTCHVDDRTEQAIWRAAKVLDVKTTAFLDSSLNISVRFMDDSWQEVLPDRVSMIEESARQRLQALGLTQEALFISGDLYKSYIQAQVKGPAKAKVRSRLRQSWGVKDKECLILFASDYIQEMQARGVHFQVTEFDSLTCLLDLLKSGDIQDHFPGAIPPYRLVIRTHPKDTVGKYEAYPAQSTKNVTILIDEAGPATDAVFSSDIVAGLGSSLLKEAGALGVEVLELGPIVIRRKAH